MGWVRSAHPVSKAEKAYAETKYMHTDIFFKLQ